MSFEKASSLQRKEKNAGHTRKEDKEIAEKDDWRRVSAPDLPGAAGARPF
ncbi:hypothetical protein SM907_25155 (plasmid) [Klebsiella aerogenes]|nr:hypothetical protein [Klebsiella aerogenes]WPS11003.1 hypothetical protein SM907_25155 [Klebsiella aerogenes]